MRFLGAPSGAGELSRPVVTGEPSRPVVAASGTSELVESTSCPKMHSYAVQRIPAGQGMYFNARPIVPVDVDVWWWERLRNGCDALVKLSGAVASRLEGSFLLGRKKRTKGSQSSSGGDLQDSWCKGQEDCASAELVFIRRGEVARMSVGNCEALAPGRCEPAELVASRFSFDQKTEGDFGSQMSAILIEDFPFCNIMEPTSYD